MRVFLFVDELCVVLSCTQKTDVHMHVEKRVAEIQWFGVVQLQFLCPDEGEPVLIDFNGRMFGSQEFSVACGMRAMDTWARLATGRSTIPSEMVVGRRYQSLEGDLRRALT